MSASVRDIVWFFVGIVAAGLVPVVMVPGVDSAALVAGARAVPLEHVLVLACIAILLAVWADIDSTGRPSDSIERRE